MKEWFLNLFKKKDNNRVPLVHVHTFKTGEKLYTYDSKYYGTIASRYWYALNQALNYITMFGNDQHSVKSALLSLQEQVQNMTLGKEIQDNGFKANTTIEFMKSYIMNKTSLQLKYHEVLFTMFYLLEDELEGGYSDRFNEKKLQLINQDEKMRDLFFSSVETIQSNLNLLLEVSIPQQITNLVNQLNSKQNIHETSKPIG